METTLLVIGISIIAVAFFILAMSLTLIFKGKNIESEIEENNEMKKLGIKCAKQQLLEEERLLHGVDCTDFECSEDGCSSCTGNGKL